MVGPGLLASGALSAHGWAGEVGRSEPEPARGAPCRCLIWRPQYGRSAPAAEARMSPGAAGRQVPMRPDLGVAREGSSLLPTSPAWAAPTTLSPSPGAHACLPGLPGEERFWASTQTRTGLVTGREAGRQVVNSEQLLGRSVCRPLCYPLPRGFPCTEVEVAWWPPSPASCAVGKREAVS